MILAITTPKSLKVKDKEIYYVQSERNIGIRYRANFEDGTCTCRLQTQRRNLQALLQDSYGEGDNSIMSQYKFETVCVDEPFWKAICLWGCYSVDLVMQ